MQHSTDSILQYSTAQYRQYSTIYTGPRVSIGFVFYDTVFQISLNFLIHLIPPDKESEHAIVCRHSTSNLFSMAQCLKHRPTSVRPAGAADGSVLIQSCPRRARKPNTARSGGTGNPILHAAAGLYRYTPAGTPAGAILRAAAQKTHT